MLSLPQVLHEAQRHAVAEIAIEPGQPATLHGDQGALVLGDALTEASISDALTRVLAPDQQAELAVASVVEFHVEGYAEWNLVAETGAEGVVIRGKIREGATPDEVGTPLDIPPLEPFEPDRAPEVPHAPASVLPTAGSRSTRWDVGVAGAVVEEVVRSASGAIVDPTLIPSADHDTGSRAVAGELEPPPAAPEAPIDFALVGRGAPTSDVPELDPFRQATVPRLANDDFAQRPTMGGSDTLSQHVSSLAMGTVIYLSGVGVGEQFLQHLADGYEIVDDHTWDLVTTRPFEEMSPDAAYLVRLEDPSRCLPWLLRRLEEGARLVVETRARTAAGCRRIMLGAEAMPAAAAWLDAHPQMWLHTERTGWVLEPLELP
ncbi:MAG: hypothetical protein K0V04_25280 [Deltaproteobacteria bacterium]|nr:hypothetical protein [Deltaproteobacteria bacterium]